MRDLDVSAECVQKNHSDCARGLCACKCHTWLIPKLPRNWEAAVFDLCQGGEFAESWSYCVDEIKAWLRREDIPSE